MNRLNENESSVLKVCIFSLCWRIHVHGWFVVGLLCAAMSNELETWTSNGLGMI